MDFLRLGLRILNIFLSTFRSRNVRIAGRDKRARAKRQPAMTEIPRGMGRILKDYARLEATDVRGLCGWTHRGVCEMPIG